MKVNSVVKEAGKSAFAKYREVYYGTAPLLEVIHVEAAILIANSVPGALGLWLRSKLYRTVFASCGSGVVFGRHLTLRHPHKIRLGRNVIIDDNVVLDAKGEDNHGITIGDNVYIGRNTIVYCKNGDIALEKGVNLSSNCQMFSAHNLTVGAGTVVGAFSYFLSGGEYDMASPVPFAEQGIHPAKGDLTIGRNCWIGAHVTIVDGASVGEHCVVGAGAVVTQPLPADSVAVGVPAKVIRSLKKDEA
jgi:acetyltransferase-like isoleucine patch superfamily enzyme